MSCVKTVEDFQTHRSERSTIQRANFFFDVPEYITLPTYEKDLAHPLPPSIGVIKPASSALPPGNDAISGHCEVLYWLEARILKDDKSVCISRREIIVIPTAETPPPLHPEDLKSDYRLSATSSLASFWKPKKNLRVSVSCAEPCPISIPSPTIGGNSAGTEILLNFNSWKIFENSESLIIPPLTECEVAVTLEAITYFLERGHHRALSIAEIGRSSSAILKRKAFKTQKRKLKLNGWKTMAEAAGPDATRMVELMATASLVTLLPDDVPYVPSFFSTLVSRRYAFGIKITFGSKVGGKPVQLRVPVQIVYAPARKYLDGPPDSEFEDDLKAPAYVP